MHVLVAELTDSDHHQGTCRICKHVQGLKQKSSLIYNIATKIGTCGLRHSLADWYRYLLSALLFKTYVMSESYGLFYKKKCLDFNDLL